MQVDQVQRVTAPDGNQYVLIRILRADGTYHRTSILSSYRTRVLAEVEVHLQRLGEGGLSESDRTLIHALAADLFTPEIDRDYTDEHRPSIVSDEPKGRARSMWERLLKLLRRDG